jgi:hypothetical protein
MSRLFSLILRERDREMLLGDLHEERAVLAASLPPREVARWYRRQVIRSIAPVVWANIRRGSWLKTLGAAIAGYFVVMLLVMLGDTLMSKLKVPEAFYAPASLAVGFPVMLLGGYLAAWMRPRGAFLLAAISVVMGVVSLAFTGDGAPLWYQLALIVIGPVASIAGGRIRLRGQHAKGN